MAEQRCEQFSILSLLRLYIECVPIDELSKLKENDNVHIVDRIAKMMENPTISVSTCLINIKHRLMVNDTIRQIMGRLI